MLISAKRRRPRAWGEGPRDWRAKALSTVEEVSPMEIDLMREGEWLDVAGS